MDHIVVDIEIRKTIEETPGGWDATDQLGVSCAVTYEYREDRFRVWGEEHLPMLRHRLLSADRITGYNIWKFDIPVIWGIQRNSEVTEQQHDVLKKLQPKTDDLLRRIWVSLGLDPDVFHNNPPPGKPAHSGWGLEKVCIGTLGVGKIGHGAEAPRLFQSGQWCSLINYCVDDVTLERDLCNFIERYGFVVHGDSGQMVKISKEWRV